ncbi:MAG: hypothetical protein KAV45_00165 [Calditrichia bacterium]|nr:hypothetical protein [Calditrichia bacterium]
MDQIQNLSHQELLRLIEVYAKNWLAHDGCWFLAAEEKYGMDAAMELDAKSWERFAVSEARRIMKEFDIPSNGGLKALEKAFQYRLYAAINKQKIEWLDNNTMIFKMLECRVQKVRRQKNLPDFPCKQVGIVEFSQFAKTIDPRIKTKCIACPPDEVADFFCAWEFTLS